MSPQDEPRWTERRRKRKRGRGQAHFEIRFSREGGKRLLPELEAPLRLVADGRKRKLLAEPAPDEAEEEIPDSGIQDDLPGLLDDE